jgi:hypothetical protein
MVGQRYRVLVFVVESNVKFPRHENRSYMVQNQGRERGEASAEEFKQYVEDSFQWIDKAQAEP